MIKFSLLVAICLLKSVLGSYDSGYGSSHPEDFYEPSYPASPVHPVSHHHGHSAGSYYHYHVPLVGQNHYQPSYHQDHSHYLWPLLLLLALPLLFLPLLPLLLLPLGISLLALLAPGGMMMMMMMMMMGGEMMMRRDTVSGRAFTEISRTFGEALSLDMTMLLSKYARSLDMDQCPQLVACEMGAIVFPETNSTDASTAKTFSNFLMDQYFPRGTVRKAIKAFWSGSTNVGNCKAFNCQPKFRVYENPPEGSSSGGGSKPLKTVVTSQSIPLKNGTVGINSKSGSNGVEQQANDVFSGTSTASPKQKTKRSQLSAHHKFMKVDNWKQSSGTDFYPKKSYFSNVLGTPTVKS